MAAKAHEARRRNKAMAEIAFTQEPSQPQIANDPFGERLSRAQDRLLDELLDSPDAKSKAALAQALRNLRETYHLVTGEARPGVRKESARKPAGQPPGGWHLPAACGQQPTTNSVPASKPDLTKPQAGQVADGQVDAGSGI